MEGLKDSVTFDFVTPLSEKWCMIAVSSCSGVESLRSFRSFYERGGSEEIEMWCNCERGSRILE